MSHIPTIAATGAILLALWVVLAVKKAKTPDPEEKEKEEEFDERVIFMKDHVYTWKKAKNE